MNKNELVSAVSERSGLSKKDTEKALQAFVDSVTEELVAGGKVLLVGFGVFDVVDRKARVGRNPRTGGPLDIEASKAPRFRVGKTLRDAVNGIKGDEEKDEE
ncbi:MAG: HU family DNA-binding protein [Clostridiales bacterium]|jgi:DNA-binding protein HU-beta|nr:HU family DNA-binding protein [Clostridiales bacterium]